ncbi:MAG: DUF2283 domain-containing protein [Candidatus Scalindua sp.]
MKVKYNAEVDALVIRFSDEKIDESGEDNPGVILDYDKDGNVVRIEILKASQRIGNPRNIEFEVA